MGIFSLPPRAATWLTVRSGFVVLAALVASVSASPAWALSAPRIYWTSLGPGAIGEATLDGTGINQSFVSGVSFPYGVAVDGQYIYWAEYNAHMIGRATLDGMGVDQSFITGASGPFAVAVNRQHIYWVNFDSGTIGRANLDGTAVNQSFITGASDPEGLAVDGQHIYWSNTLSGTIGRANLDGTGVNQSFITGATQPKGVAVDGQHIYWTEEIPSTIGEANLDGTAVNHSFITAADFTERGMAVDSQHIYWSTQNTIGEANLDGTGVNQSFIAVGGGGGLAVSVPVMQVTPASPPAFGTTSQGLLSSPLMLTVSNAGLRALSISGLSFTGSNPGDFFVSSNSCLGAVAPGESCQIGVSFAPQGEGPRSASLQILSNDYADSPLLEPLSGTGGALPRGPRGPAGARGPAGKVELVTCRTVKTKVHGHRRKVKKCSARIVSGPVRFTTTAADRVTVSRGRVTYATGTSVELRPGVQQLLLSCRRRLRPGRYTLKAHTGHGLGTLTTGSTITITG
jgi:hypothetical protein